MESLNKYFYLVVTDQVHGVLPMFLRAFLTIFSLFYLGIVLGARRLYVSNILNRHKLPCPVIAVGNITWGGVGKTPLVILIARYLQQKGLQPVILTRGYGPKNRGSDEAKVIQQELPGIPVLVGRDRIAMAKDFLKSQRSDVFLLDDGFQHWRLSRDLDVVAIDAANPFGNGFLIPRGILREPLSALKCADLFVLTKTDLAGDTLPNLRKRLSAIHHVPMIETAYKPGSLKTLSGQQEVGLSYLKGRRVAMFCGIGDPTYFQYTLERLGAQVVLSRTFLDHHWYTPAEIDQLIQEARTWGADCLVTTAKDAVRIKDYIPRFKAFSCLVLIIGMEIVKGQDDFFNRIHSVLCR